MMTYHIWNAIAAFKELADVSGVRMKGADFFSPSRVERRRGTNVQDAGNYL